MKSLAHVKYPCSKHVDLGIWRNKRNKSVQDGEQRHPLQKGDHVEFRTWRGKDGKAVAVRVERVKERSRAVGSNGGGGNGGGSGFRAIQAHFR